MKLRKQDRIDFVGEYIKQGKVLDVGANGSLDHRVYKKINKYVVGVDLSKNNYANENDFTIGDAEKLSKHFHKDYFDVIVAGDVIEHLRRPYAFLQESLKVLKKDGRIIIMAPNARMNWWSWMYCRDMELHLHSWDLMTLKRLVIDAGFEIEEEGYLAQGLFHTLLMFMPQKAMHMYVVGRKNETKTIRRKI